MFVTYSSNSEKYMILFPYLYSISYVSLIQLIQEIENPDLQGNKKQPEITCMKLIQSGKYI
jgi:hypothetical protein